VPTLSQPIASSRRSPASGASTFAQHRGYLCLATAMLGMLALLFIAGCQTPGAPATVAPPATGMIGQPAQYGSWATPPQGAAYPPTASAPPMPGPATQWQGAAPATTQPAGTMPPQQFVNQMPASANQFTQGVNGQTQQFANQTQQQLAAQQQQLNNQAQAAVNQYQQNAANQWQQMNNQLQGQTQQAFNNAQQQGQQYINQGQQAVTAQMPQYPVQQPTTNTSWNPFSTSAMSQPPARATPVTTVPRY
jgi:hypothetical protein